MCKVLWAVTGWSCLSIFAGIIITIIIIINYYYIASILQMKKQTQRG